MKGKERKAECRKKKLCSVVGAGLRTRPQNGITLIALIITIIVMLILVGVTINVALNGGLFEQAQEASKNTQIEADREQLLSAIVASYDIETGTIKSESELRKNLGDGWTVVKEGSVYKVTSPKGNIFTVDAKGNIIGINAETYTFTIKELVAMEEAEFDDSWAVPFENFWKEGVSENLKNSTIVKEVRFRHGSDV